METLYRRNNNGVPTFWKAKLDTDRFDNMVIQVEHGIVGGKVISSTFPVTQKDPMNELRSKYADKRKLGYLGLDEIKDDKGCSPVEGDDVLYRYLNAYLPKNLNNSDTGAILPMLAKTYTGNIWKKTSLCSAQWKINGLRCLISAYRTNDIFRPIRLRFQSREGLYWDTLDNLEDYMLNAMFEQELNRMVEENIVLDGEIYLPGHSVNEINHFVKDPKCKENKLLQYWMYDVAIPDTNVNDRNDIRIDLSDSFSMTMFKTYNEHMNNDKRLIYVPNNYCYNDDGAVKLRNNAICIGFEGIVLRNLDMEYQFGRRRSNYMEKFKDVTDGIFEIIAIDKEQKRNLPIFTCRNDINEATFECSINGTHNYQETILNNKEQFIGKRLSISFGERSGVNRVPFQLKKVKLVDA